MPAAGTGGGAGAAGAPVDPDACVVGMRCGDQCVQIQSDAMHCGGCNRRCDAPMGGTASCVAGQCVAMCPAPQMLCEGRCVAVQTDRDNCGACGNRCAAGGGQGMPMCSAGRCTVMCQMRRTECGGMCVDTERDAAHCGGCNMRCGSNQRCMQAQCRGMGLNVAELERLVNRLGGTLDDVASVLGIPVDELEGAQVTLAQLERAGITIPLLQLIGVTVEDLERIGIDVGNR